MKSYVIAILLGISVFSASCKKSAKANCDGPDLNCTGVFCIMFWSHMDFKLVDKTTREDLLFGPSPRYTFSDIKIFSDPARTNALALNEDNAAKKIRLGTARAEMYLEIKGTTVYKLTVEFKAEDCCTNRAKSVWIDGKEVCVCCNDVIAIPVD